MDGTTEKNTGRVEWARIAFLVILVALLYAGTCSRPQLFDETDATNAGVAYRMHTTGDWVTPYLNYVPRLNKPPMIYWLIAASYELFEVSDFTTRLPLAVTAICLVLTAYALGNMLSRNAGFYAGLALATSGGYFLFTRMIGGDVPFVLFLSLGFYCFLRAYLDGRRWEMPGFYAALALAVLSKGLIGLVFPILIIGAFLIVRRDLKFVKRMQLVPGALILLLIAGPWHLLVERSNPGFLYNYFVDEHVMRFLGRHYPKDFRSIHLWAFWTVIAAGLFPWLMYIEPVWRLRSRDDRNSALLQFLGLWAVVVIGFFSVSARLEHYSLPAFVPLTVLAGFAFAQAEEGANARWLRGAAAVTAAVCLLTVLASAMMLHLISGAATFSSTLGEHDNMTYFSAAGGLSVASLKAMRWEMAAVGVGMLIVGASALALARGGEAATAAVGMALGMAIVCVAVQSALVAFGPYLSLKGFAERIDRDWRAGDVIVAEGEYFNSSSLGFYTRKPVYRWRGHPEWDFGSRFGDARRMYLDDCQLAQLWRSKRRVFLVAGREPEFAPAAILIGRSGERRLYTNRESR